MHVLIACEFSGIVREAFRKKGHEAWSCDLLPSENGGMHIMDDVLGILQISKWDLMIAFPPCTHLCSSGARWFKYKKELQQQAIDFFIRLAMTDRAEKICIENPIGIMSNIYRKPDQIIQPWQFGHGEIKSTCLWLKGLPKLVATDIVPGRVPRVHRSAPSPERWKERSRTLQGIADAMADQWG